MNKKSIALTGALIVFSIVLSAQGIQQFNAAEDPVDWGNPNAAQPGTVYVSRYGYWCNQPVKMAYWIGLPHMKIPPFFHLVNENGTVVFSGTPAWMRDPTRVMVPIGFFYPGVKMYALNFSGFQDAGTYWIEVPGYPNSIIFHIKGYIPGTMIPMPGLLTFERDAGISPNPDYQRHQFFRQPYQMP